VMKYTYGRVCERNGPITRLSSIVLSLSACCQSLIVCQRYSSSYGNYIKKVITWPSVVEFRTFLVHSSRLDRCDV